MVGIKKFSARLVLAFFLGAFSACQPFAPDTAGPLQGSTSPRNGSETPLVLADTVFSATAFVDTNGNGTLDDDDTPLEGAQFIAEGFGSQTDKNGYAMILIPGEWNQPIRARMVPPANHSYQLIGPEEIVLQDGVINQAHFLFAVSEGNAPTKTPLQVDIPYCTTSEGVQLTMDVYRPKQVNGAAPVVVYIHGGGWTGGDKSDGVGIVFREELSRRGYIFVSINYRLAPKYTFPAPIEDVKCAVRHLRANAEHYGLDPQRIGVIGGSAGGHLAALLGASDLQPGWDVGEYLDQSSRVQAVVVLYGPADLTRMLADSPRSYVLGVFGASNHQDPILAKFSPVTYITPDDPPFLILHGDQDRVVLLEQSEILYEKLLDQQVPARLIVVKNAGHSFQSNEGKIEPDFPGLFKLVGDFFDQYLR